MTVLKISMRMLISQRNQRILAIIVSTCQVIISHVLLFLSVLGTIHASEIESMLCADIDEENEINAAMMEYSPTPNNHGESVNQIRFESAKELASDTLVNLCFLSGIAGVYLLTCLLLMIGMLKNRPDFLVVWLISNLVAGFLLLTVVISGSEKLIGFIGGLIPYWSVFVFVFALDIFSWIIVHGHYKNLMQNKKLAERYVESATVKIPFHYRKENIYLGNNGMKHHVCDPLVDENNYVM